MARSEAGARAPPVDLRIGYDRDPAAVPEDDVRFSWRVPTDGRGHRQSAYRLRVARDVGTLRDGGADVWDTGRVESDRATDVAYGGPDLDADATYWWTVRVWDGDGEASEWAEPARFATALGDAGDWEGAWLAHEPNGGDANGYRSEWTTGPDEQWVRIDLGERRDVAEVTLYPAEPLDGPETPDGFTVSPIHGKSGSRQGGAEGFGFPVEYRVEAATDPEFEDAWTVADRTGDAQPNPGAEPVTLDADGRARYLRVVATEPYEFDPFDPPGRGPQYKPDLVREAYESWHVVALAAVAVRTGDGVDVARGADVTASSSVESASWGRDMLVDGHYESRFGAASPLLRREVALTKPVAEARAHVCTLGCGELYVNGERIGDEVLDPAWTDYDERALYTTHDVTDALGAGENALGIWLGRGRFGQNAGGWTAGGSPRAILQLHVEYEDGTTRTVTTDEGWDAAESPLVENDLYDGEVYDARRERPGWATPGHDATDWDDAARVEGPDGTLVPQRTPPMRRVEERTPEAIHDHEDGPIVDFGQNLTGWVELVVQDGDAGDEIDLRYAEIRLDDGSLNRIDLEPADPTDTYVCAGDDVETYEPRFTYHGFRYVQVDGYPGDLDADDVTARVVHTDMPETGSFDCSNEELAQVQHNAEWSLRGNSHGIPTDCPQRAERLGWTGDGHIAGRALMYNFESVRFHEKWLRDHADQQSEHGYVADTVPFAYGTIPEDRTWALTQVTLPWHLYRHFGDRRVLERHYENMRRYVDYWHDVAEDGIIGEEAGNYGDWLAFENADGRRGLPFDLFNTAFHYHTVSLFADIAGVLGNEGDRERYAERAAAVKAAFNDRFFDPETATYGPGTQSSYAVPLFVGLVPEEHEAAVADGLAEAVRDAGGKLQTGFLGARPLINALADYGHADVAYEVVSQPERPGWVYMVRNGATTMWERWDSDDRIGDGMNSFNHSPFTFVSEWFFSALAGLDFDDSVAEGLTVAPRVVDALDWASASLETVDGEAAVRWETEGDALSLDVTVPWNTSATVRVPDAADATVTEGGDALWDGGAADSLPDGVASVERDGDAVVVEVGAGSYAFERP
ncbi:MAG: family 78 glycoside hydrolase catalytic domain [Halobacteriaceae archaeon]